jgi:hypothetical protein
MRVWSVYMIQQWCNSIYLYQVLRRRMCGDLSPCLLFICLKACWLCPVTILSSSVQSSFVSTLFPWNILCLLNVYYCYSFQRNLHFTYEVALIHTHTQECFIFFIPSCKGSRVNSCSFTVLLLHFIWYCKYILVLRWDISMSLHHESNSVQTAQIIAC